jgi:hypothetical protein
MEKLLSQLVEKLQKAYGERLVSVVLYGSAAAGDYQAKFSDLNVLCVLTRVTPRELGAAEQLFRWWRERGNPSPLLVSEAEVAGSTDCFAIEFHDIARHHRVLYGRDALTGLAVNDRYYRAQVEHELRAKLFRLRQKAAGAFSDDGLMRRVLADSVSTFCVLFRHALALDGHEAPAAKREVIEQAREHFAIDPAPFLQLLDLREERVKAREIDPAPLLSRYLEGIEAVIEKVDRLE